MSDYAKTTNFTAKDSLATGDANKRITGALFDTEFNALVTAVASKVDDGANSTITSLSGLTTPLSLGQGGVGSSTAAGARTNLGAAEVGANSTITSLSGLTTPLSLGQGGVGSSTAAGARTNLGLGALATLSTVATAQVDALAITTPKTEAGFIQGHCNYGELTGSNLTPDDNIAGGWMDYVPRHVFDPKTADAPYVTLRENVGTFYVYIPSGATTFAAVANIHKTPFVTENARMRCIVNGTTGTEADAGNTDSYVLSPESTVDISAMSGWVPVKIQAGTNNSASDNRHCWMNGAAWRIY
jgi:hypothetical protein